MNTLGVSRGDGSNVSSDATRPTSTITPISTFDNSISLQISSFKFNGQNFLSWFRPIQLIIRGKGKFGYLDGYLPRPENYDPSFSVWDINNSMVIS